MTFEQFDRINNATLTDIYVHRGDALVDVFRVDYQDTDIKHAVNAYERRDYLVDMSDGAEIEKVNVCAKVSAVSNGVRTYTRPVLVVFVQIGTHDYPGRL